MFMVFLVKLLMVFGDIRQNRALEELVRDSASCGVTPLVFCIVPPSLVEAGDGHGAGAAARAQCGKSGR